MATASCILHATCIVVEGHGVLITGPSGSGKSALGLQLMAIGGALVADDRTALSAIDGMLHASPPPTIAGMIEARGVGILTVPYQREAVVSLAVDMGQLESTRLPTQHSTCLLDIALPCLHKVDAPYFAAAIRAYMLGKRNETL